MMKVIATLLLLPLLAFAVILHTTKDPRSTEDFFVDWSSVTDQSTSISASTWSIVPTGMTVVAQSFTPSMSKIRLSRGTLGVNYTVTDTVTLSDGQILVYSFIINVENQ